MIGLDTNVIVRFLVNDDKEQSPRATAWIAKAERSKTALFVSDIVLAETVWVLARAYKFRRLEIVNAIRGLISASNVVVNDADVAHEALNAYEAGKADFADYMIRAQARRAGCKTVVTFDGALSKEAGFRSL